MEGLMYVTLWCYVYFVILLTFVCRLLALYFVISLACKWYCCANYYFC